MKKELLGCTISSLIIIMLGLVSLHLLGYLPIFKECGSKMIPYRISKTIEESIDKNVFMWEYEPAEVQYKDANIKIYSAFVEHSHYYQGDSLYVLDDDAILQIFFDDYKSLKYKGYKDNWLINDYLYLTNFGHVQIECHRGEFPLDTFRLYIRECNPTLDSLKNDYPNTFELEHYIKWDTVQCIELVRKKCLTSNNE